MICVYAKYNLLIFHCLRNVHNGNLTIKSRPKPHKYTLITKHLIPNGDLSPYFVAYIIQFNESGLRRHQNYRKYLKDIIGNLIKIQKTLLSTFCTYPLSPSRLQSMSWISHSAIMALLDKPGAWSHKHSRNSIRIV